MDNFKLKHLLGKRVYELRKTRGLTQQQLADKMGIEVRTLGRIEKGINFPSRYIISLAESLDVTLSQLYEFEHLDISEDDIKKFIKDTTDKLPPEHLTIIYRMINSMYN